jgi:DNA-binding CsgD family transcriptional regulator
LLASGALVLVIAIIERFTKAYLSLGLLYSFPMVFAAGYLPRWAVVLLALICPLLSAPSTGLDMFALEFLALSGCGLFSGECIRHHRLSTEAQERLRVVVETMPAAIFAVDARGLIEHANRAAIDLLLPRDGQLNGCPIAAFFPELHYALRSVEGPQTATRCRAYRGNGEPFIAHASCSTYKEGPSLKLTVVIADVTEATLAVGSSPPSGGTNNRPWLSDRESEVLRFLVHGLVTKEIAARMDISESTTKNALQQLFAKTNVRSRAQLVKVAMENYRDLLSGPAPETSRILLPTQGRDTALVVECGHGARGEKVRGISAGRSLTATPLVASIRSRPKTSAPRGGNPVRYCLREGLLDGDPNGRGLAAQHVELRVQH